MSIICGYAYAWMHSSRIYRMGKECLFIMTHNVIDVTCCCYTDEPNCNLFYSASKNKMMCPTGEYSSDHKPALYYLHKDKMPQSYDKTCYYNIEFEARNGVLVKNFNKTTRLFQSHYNSIESLDVRC